MKKISCALFPENAVARIENFEPLTETAKARIPNLTNHRGMGAQLALNNILDITEEWSETEDGILIRAGNIQEDKNGFDYFLNKKDFSVSVSADMKVFPCLKDHALEMLYGMKGGSLDGFANFAVVVAYELGTDTIERLKYKVFDSYILHPSCERQTPEQRLEYARRLIVITQITHDGALIIVGMIPAYKLLDKIQVSDKVSKSDFFKPPKPDIRSDGISGGTEGVDYYTTTKTCYVRISSLIHSARDLWREVEESRQPEIEDVIRIMIDKAITRKRAARMKAELQNNTV